LPDQRHYDIGYWHFALVSDTLFAEARGLLTNNEKTLIPPTAEWRYLCPANGVDPATDHPDFHERFAASDFDDSQWDAGQDSPGLLGGLGYGDPAGVAWPTPPAGDRKTAYLRHRFNTDEPVNRLILEGQFDDGIIVYLDGIEVGRNNVAPNKPNRFDLTATIAIGSIMEPWTRSVPLLGNLDPGDHVLAISLHNHSIDSSDLRIGGIKLYGSPVENGAGEKQ
jgi:hypothetical protein